MALYVRTSKRTAVGLPWWLAIPACAVWLVIGLAMLLYACAAWVVVYCVVAWRGRAVKRR